MKTVNIDEAKRHLSKLIDEASKGKSFVIAKAGKPMVKVVPLDSQRKPQRLGFMRGEFSTPENFDQMNSKEISKMFETSE